jgi:hypothetical protein
MHVLVFVLKSEIWLYTIQPLGLSVDLPNGLSVDDQGVKIKLKAGVLIMQGICVVMSGFKEWIGLWTKWFL